MSLLRATTLFRIQGRRLQEFKPQHPIGSFHVRTHTELKRSYHNASLLNTSAVSQTSGNSNLYWAAPLLLSIFGLFETKKKNNKNEETLLLLERDVNRIQWFYKSQRSTEEKIERLIPGLLSLFGNPWYEEVESRYNAAIVGLLMEVLNDVNGPLPYWNQTMTASETPERLKEIMKSAFLNRDKPYSIYTPLERFLLYKGCFYFNGEAKILVPLMMQEVETLMRTPKEESKAIVSGLLYQQLSDLVGAHGEVIIPVFQSELANMDRSEDVRALIQRSLTTGEREEDKKLEGDDKKT